jgi:hypothetical protein
VMYELRPRKFTMSGIDRKYLDVYEVRIMAQCTCKHVAKTHINPMVCVKIQGCSVSFL